MQLLSCPFGSSGKARRINNLPDLVFRTRDLIKVRFGRLSSIIAGGHCGDVANGTGMNGVDPHRRCSTARFRTMLVIALFAIVIVVISG